MNNRINIFLDTNIYRRLNFQIYSNKNFKILSDFIEEGIVELYINEIVIKECESQITDKAKLINKMIESLSKDMKWDLVKETDLHKTIKFEEVEQEMDLVNKSIKMFHNGLDNLKVNTLDINKGNIGSVFNNYFEQNLPFDKKKKNEFPDAFIIESIKDFLNQSADRKIHIVSQDKGFLETFNFVENCNTYDSLDSLLDYINSEIYAPQHEMAKQIIKESEEEIIKAVAIKTLSSINIDLTQNYLDRYYEEINIMSFKNFEIEEIMINSFRNEVIEAGIKCTFNIGLEATYDDYENSIWDSEEKDYFYLKVASFAEYHLIDTVLNLELLKSDKDDEYIIENIQIDIDLGDETLIERINLKEPSQLYEDFIEPNIEKDNE